MIDAVATERFAPGDKVRLEPGTLRLVRCREEDATLVVMAAIDAGEAVPLVPLSEVVSALPRSVRGATSFPRAGDERRIASVPDPS